jgi:hypothetical protein
MSDVRKTRDLIDLMAQATDTTLDDATITAVLFILDSHHLLREFPGTAAEYHAKVQVVYAETLRQMMGGG